MKDWQQKPVEDGPTDSSIEIYEIYPKFKSARAKQELEGLNLVQEHLAHLDSRDTIDTPDPSGSALTKCIVLRSNGSAVSVR